MYSKSLFKECMDLKCALTVLSPKVQSFLVREVIAHPHLGKAHGKGWSKGGAPERL